MIALLKALIPGLFLTWLVSTLVGSKGSHGGVLAISHFTFQGHEIYGSWPLFFAATGLSWMILLMMPKG